MNTTINNNPNQINMAYLLNVPNNQKRWFRVNYDSLKSKFKETELMQYSMFENNLFGVNERFINWESDLNGLLDDYLQNWMLQEHKTLFIRDLLGFVLHDCMDLEYFEMAHNLNLILNGFDDMILGFMEAMENERKESGYNE